ncbi:hypothetical protein [Hirschia litorea]|uniref:Acyloxyacyl hydrolase n=1 Tax=Hirschia litorea TaxID=1199156 RepID=A0ABW2IKG8_9PROT
MNKALIAFATIGAGTFNMTAQADIVDSVRLGVMDHNVKVLTPKNANKEDGFNLSADVRFSKWNLSSETWSPHPYLMASVNSEDRTSYIAVGLEWDFEFLEGWHFQPSFGYALHSGKLESQGATAQERAVFDSKHLLLGSRDLFRTSFAITKDINETWALQLIYDHLSHGQILGNGRNQGLDDVGVRVAYSF